MAAICPKCGAPDVDDEKCPRCGVVIALYEVALAKFRRDTPPDLPAAAASDTPTEASGTRETPNTPSESSGTVETPPSGMLPRSTRAPAGGASTSRALTFHGHGATLFGIHVVNVLLAIVTLGIFAFWGKVRVRRYLLAHSELAGARFAYHGTGGELLIGFLKIVGLLVVPLSLFQAAAILSRESQVMLAARIMTSVVVVALVPFGIVGARRYRLSRTSWRGIRFGFDGTVAAYARIFVAGTLATLVTLGLYFPIHHARSHAFLVAHSRFGTRSFGYDGVARETFRPYLRALLLALPTLGLGLFWYLAWRRRYYWSHTTFQGARFRCTITGRRLLALWVVNVLLLLVTLGAAWPWVRVRTARLALATLTLEGPLALDAIVESAAAGSATGDALSSLVGAGFEFGA